MGREAIGKARWGGETGEVKALLESQEIILRGEIRARIARSAISAVAVSGEDLLVTAAGGTLDLTLGAVEAEKWAAALRKAPPTLAAKLGVSVGQPAFVLGPVADAELAAALDDAQTPVLADAAILIAVLHSEAELAAAFEVARSVPHLPLWCVAAKGRTAPLSDATIRSFLRGHGYIDTKTSAVSERLTATRYRVRQTS